MEGRRGREELWEEGRQGEHGMGYMNIATAVEKDEGKGGKGRGMTSQGDEEKREKAISRDIGMRCN